MTDLENAVSLFKESGLPFPTIPEALAARLEERERWLFSTREIREGPYSLAHYVEEAAEDDVDDYAVLAHSGHGVNSYALQYYLVYRNLRLFLHLGWGGAYMDPAVTADQIRECFALADEIVAAVETLTGPQKTRALTIVGSDFYGSYWYLGGDRPSENGGPADVLREALSAFTAGEAG